MGDDLSEYLAQDNGTNEMSNAKATAFFFIYDEVLNSLVQHLKAKLREQGKLDEIMDVYLDELGTFIQLRREDLINTGKRRRQVFQFKFDALMREKFCADPADYLSDSMVVVDFVHSTRQAEMIGF